LEFIHHPVLQKVEKHNVSGTGSVSVFRGEGEDTYSVGSLRKG
jgi:hypothetical protein